MPRYQPVLSRPANAVLAQSSRGLMDSAWAPQWCRSLEIAARLSSLGLLREGVLTVRPEGGGGATGVIDGVEVVSPDRLAEVDAALLRLTDGTGIVAEIAAHRASLVWLNEPFHEHQLPRRRARSS